MSPPLRAIPQAMPNAIVTEKTASGRQMRPYLIAGASLESQRLISKIHAYPLNVVFSLISIDCKDIGEMMAAEDNLRSACEMFKEIMEACLHFEGEEVLEF